MVEGPAPGRDPVGTPEHDRLTALRESARGWHRVQLAVLGFIGLCGVLQTEDASDPAWLQTWALVLAVAALAVALWAVVLVGRAAWPLYGARATSAQGADDEEELAGTSRQLRRGLALTFVSVALLALSTGTSWWPAEEQADRVEVRAGSQTLCGELGEGREGELLVRAGDAAVRVPLSAVQSLRVVDGC